MAYHTHKTEALVMKVLPLGEANLSLVLYTPDFGILNVFAQGARRINSKLRYSIQAFTHTQVSLVHGKIGWRLTNAVGITDYAVRLRPIKNSRARFARSLSLLGRLTSENDPHPDLFKIIIGYAEALSSGVFSDSDMVSAEYICALRILYTLGYVGSEATAFSATNTTHWSKELVEGTSPMTGDIVKIINNSIRESQL